MEKAHGIMTTYTLTDKHGCDYKMHKNNKLQLTSKTLPVVKGGMLVSQKQRTRIPKTGGSIRGALEPHYCQNKS